MTTSEHVCPVGHEDDWQCVEARVYGPCEHPHCTGVCVYHRDCTCTCHTREASTMTPVSEQYKAALTFTRPATVDYGTAVLTTVSGGLRTVEQADDIIGVGDDLVQALTRTGVLDGDHLTLDTAGDYRYRKLGPSTTTPGVTRYERITAEQEQQP